MQREARNARQLILRDHWTMARTAKQQCYEVVVVKNTLQTTFGRLPTRKEISDKFHRNIKLADGRQEDYSENFVKDATTIYARIWTVPHWPRSLWNKSGTATTLCGTTSASWLCWHQRLQTKKKGSGSWAR